MHCQDAQRTRGPYHHGLAKVITKGLDLELQVQRSCAANHCLFIIFQRKQKGMQGKGRQESIESSRTTLIPRNICEYVQTNFLTVIKGVEALGWKYRE